MSISLLSQSQVCICKARFPVQYFQLYDFRYNEPANQTAEEYARMITVAMHIGTFVDILAQTAAKYEVIDFRYVRHQDTVHICLGGTPIVAEIKESVTTAEGQQIEQPAEEQPIVELDAKGKPKKPKKKTKKQLQLEEKEREEKEREEKEHKEEERKEEEPKENPEEKVSKTITASSIQLEFELPLINIESDEDLEVPEMEYNVGFVMSTKELSDMIHGLHKFGDTISIVTDDTSVRLISKNEAGSTCINIPIDLLSSFEGVDGEVLNMTFRTPILDKLCIAPKLTENVEVQITEGMPITFRYLIPIVGMEDEHASVNIYAAPIIEE